MNITAKEGITDARQLGMPKYVILGVQHLFAMFGATVLVPVLTGLSVSSTLLFAGLGTLVFHLMSKLQVPAFLGSSFAFLGGYMSVKALGVEQGMTETLALDYACVGVFFAGLLYFVMAGLIKSFGIDKILHFFPPLVTGPMIIAIGLVLSGSAIQNCTTNWLAAIFAILLSFCPKFACLIGLIPTATIGGVSLILYGMISAVGVRNLIEDSTDFNSSRNVFVAASILVIAIGVKYGAEDNVSVGPIHFSGLALAALVGVVLNAVLPGKLGMKVKSVHGKDKTLG